MTAFPLPVVVAKSMAQFRAAMNCGIRTAISLPLAATLVVSLFGCATVAGLGDSSLQKSIPVEPTKSPVTDVPNEQVSDQPSSEVKPQIELPLETIPRESPNTIENAAFDLNVDASTPKLDVNSAGIKFELEPEADRLPDNVEVRLSDMSVRELTRYRLDLLAQDYHNFYQPTNLANLAIGFAAAAGMANTGFDEIFGNDLFRENFVDIANEDVTELLHQPGILGDGYFVLPFIGATALAHPWLDRSEQLRPLGEWGERSARALLTGGPLVLVMQRVTGASRPNESSSQSHWEPFQDNNGVSGHSFVGAVPFLTLAQIADHPILKVACYVGSVLPAISRINDERHYFSQVFLGWYVAFLATHAVHETQTGDPSLHFFPTFSQDGMGFMIDKRF